MNGYTLARVFHDLYEKLAPDFGYSTRDDTKQFDEESKNGKLMIEVCQQVLDYYLKQQVTAAIIDEAVNQHERIEDIVATLKRRLEGDNPTKQLRNRFNR